MLSKKAIATFAAMATFVSGIAFAMPALASNDTNFNDKFAANRDYVNALRGKSADGKTDKTYTQQDLDELKKIAASKNPVEAKKEIEDKKEKEMDTLIQVMADLGVSEEDFKKALENNNKSIDPSKLEIFKEKLQKHRSAQEKPYANAVELAKLINGGMFTPTRDEYAAAAEFLEDIKSFANKPFGDLSAAEANKAGAAALKLNNKISAALKKSVKEYNEEKEDLAKQAEAKGLRFTAKIIRDSKKSNLDLLKNLLAEAEKIKKSESAKAPEVPGAAGQDSPEVSPEALPEVSPEDKSIEAPAAPSVPTVPGAAAKSESAKPESAAKSSQAKAVVPSAPASVDQLKPELKGMLTVGSNNIAVAGSANKVSVNVNNKAFLDRLHREGSVKAYAFIYSTPKLLRSVDGSDFVTVKLGSDGVPYFDAQFPAGYSGNHTVVLVDEQGNQLGWTDITVENNTASQGDGKGVLPATGVGGALVAFAALMFAAFGAVLRKVRS